jgi:hypothetical protein
MADTATSADTRDALCRLAARFAALAESRTTDQVGRCAKTGSLVLLPPTNATRV